MYAPGTDGSHPSVPFPLDIQQAYTYDNKGNMLTQQTRNSTASTFIKGATAYTTDQNYAATQTDARGKTVSTVTDANGQTVKTFQA